MGDDWMNVIFRRASVALPAMALSILLSQTEVLEAATFTAWSQAGSIGCSDPQSSSAGVTSVCSGTTADLTVIPNSSNLPIEAISSSAPGTLSVEARTAAASLAVGPNGTGPFGLYGGETKANALFSDTLSFSILSGTFLIPVDYNGTLIQSSLINANGSFTSLSGSISSNTGGSLTFGASQNSGAPINGNTSGVENALFPIVNGQLRLSGALLAIARPCLTGLSTGDFCTASANYGASMRLLGGSIFDDGGNLLTGASVSSESGFNYLVGAEPHTPPVATVSIPASAFLLFSGLVGMFRVLRSKETRRVTSTFSGSAVGS
jgi:hypothetical protein